ncbi:MAG: orotate phosphoribosyltransferase [Candidatus Eisenbacteria bacterium]|nr:orotate phosphoribosyltransferase [Candidatus Eisenbacteria bacterium]
MPPANRDISNEEARRCLADIIRRRSVKTGRFRLASGAESNYYVDLRRTTTHPEGAYLAALLLIAHIRQWDPDAAGGPTIGVDPLAGAMAALTHAAGEKELRTFMVRGQVKDHGTGRRIEGSLESGDRTVILDDVVTSGGSLLRVLDPVREAGGIVVGATALLDREQGAAAALEEAGIPFQPIFRISELIDAKLL